ncbi:MAG TPA: efflux RND transporter periplasmic adaptor subunit [Acidobacteriota bacterium]
MLTVRNVMRIAVLIVILPLLYMRCGGSQAETPAPKPMQVEVATVLQQDIPIYSEWITTLDGFVNAQIQPQVSGYLVKQDYQEGAVVHKGQILFEIDPRPFEAVLNQAKAQLGQAEAALGKAKQDVKRDQPMAELHAIAQSQLDDDVQAELGAEATVASARAAVQTAALNLEFTKVRSLVDGVAGIAKGQIGDLVGPQTILTSISQVDPIKAYVSLSESDYLKFGNRIHPYTSVKDLGKDKDLVAELILGDGSTYPSKGSFIIADRQVDVGTGTIRIAAAFPNPDNRLRPGQFGRVRTTLSVKKNALIVPQRAVTELQGSYQVSVVGKDNKVSIRPIQVGERVGSNWLIQDGLKAGEVVIAEGSQKVTEGSSITPKPFQPETASK